MSNLTPFPAGTLTDYTIRGVVTVPRLRPSDPGVNQASEDTVAGLGSADYDEAPTEFTPSGDSVIVFDGGSA